MAEAGLFEGRTYVLTDEHPGLIELVRDIGAKPLILRAEDHDRIVAYTSHLPQLLSTVLANTVGTALQSESEMSVAGRGLDDMTRLAGSSFEIWKDILDTNHDSIVRALDLFLDNLSQTRDSLRSAWIGESFQQGAVTKDRLRRNLL
jgi:prephenate dehydrogenase